jgi:hypothetical protein
MIPKKKTSKTAASAKKADTGAKKAANRAANKQTWKGGK